MKTKGQTLIHVLTGFLCLFSCIFTYGQKEIEKVLFVGNSYTYFWNLPKTVQTMAEGQGSPLVVRQSTAGGVSWKGHWNGVKGLRTRDLMVEQDWDLIVLQNHSLSTIDSLDSFLQYGRLLIELAKNNGSEVVLYQTWARKANPLMLSHIKKGYDQLGDEKGLEVIKVGEVWEEIRKLRPELELYDPDGSHPSTIGTYLNACIFFRALTGLRTESIPKRIVTKDENQQPLYLSILSQEDADFLQNIVDQFFNQQSHE